MSKSGKHPENADLHQDDQTIAMTKLYHFTMLDKVTTFLILNPAHLQPLMSKKIHSSFSW